MRHLVTPEVLIGNGKYRKDWAAKAGGGALVIRELNADQGKMVRELIEKSAADHGVELAVTTRDTLPDSANRPFVLGFSAAGKDALALAVKHRAALAGLVLVAAPLDVDAAAAKALGKGFPVLLVYGTKDSVATDRHAEALAKVLRTAGVDAKVHAVATTDHFKVLSEGADAILMWMKKRSAD